MALNVGMGYVQRGGSADTPNGYNPAYGGIPDIPDYSTNTTTVVGTDKQQQLMANLPGYMGMVNADVGNIYSNLGGYVGGEALARLQRQAAERGVGVGAYPGSANTDAAYLRALGLTELQLQQLGHTQLGEAMARTPIQERTTTTNRIDNNVLKAIYAAAPNPAAAAAEALRIAQMGAGAGGSYRGGVGSIGAAMPTTYASGGGGLTPGGTPPIARTDDFGAPSPSYYAGVIGDPNLYSNIGLVWDPTTGNYVPKQTSPTYAQFANPGGWDSSSGAMTAEPIDSYYPTHSGTMMMGNDEQWWQDAIASLPGMSEV